MSSVNLAPEKKALLEINISSYLMQAEFRRISIIKTHGLAKLPQEPQYRLYYPKRETEKRPVKWKR